MPNMPEQPLVPVAQYLRMSREHQRYSIRNQARAISAYAQNHGLNIVKTYTDPGTSGLTLRERPGLQTLLAEVIKPTRMFEHVLVLDVSRWGRFQNLDQSGHYEFICFEAGASVIYCAEKFENDGTPVMALLKQIKRLQAAEYTLPSGKHASVAGLITNYPPIQRLSSIPKPSKKNSRNSMNLLATCFPSISGLLNTEIATFRSGVVK